MDGHHDFEIDSDRLDSRSDAMRAALSCLGGARFWTGSVSGLFGVINRRFTIESQGRANKGALIFSETLCFDDGEVQERAWTLSDGTDGLVAKGDNVAPLKPGQVIPGGFEISYRIKFGSIWFDYHDVFRTNPNGGVSNLGVVSLLGVTVMNIKAEASPAPNNERKDS